MVCYIIYYNRNNPWWKVTLSAYTEISAVQITTRGHADNTGEFLNYSVRVDGTTCASHVAIANGKTTLVPCSGAGTVVKLKLMVIALMFRLFHLFWSLTLIILF